MAFKVLHDLGPTYLKDGLLPPRASQSSDCYFLDVPPFQDLQGPIIFSVIIPTLWNEFPKEGTAILGDS